MIWRKILWRKRILRKLKVIMTVRASLSAIIGILVNRALYIQKLVTMPIGSS